METFNVTLLDPMGETYGGFPAAPTTGGQEFQSLLKAQTSSHIVSHESPPDTGPPEIPASYLLSPVKKMPTWSKKAVAAYDNQIAAASPAHPGYGLKETGPATAGPADPLPAGGSLLSRIGRGIADAFRGIGNFFRRLFSGSAPPPPARETPSTPQSHAMSQPIPRGLEESKGAGMTEWEKYKDDQLLSNPGGDGYDLESKTGLSDPAAQETFFGRVGKDISDAFANIQNFFKNFFFGSKIRYRDEENRIQEARQRGLLGSIGDFFKDLGSALSFGTWRPDGEKEPQGFGERLKFFFSKMKEAVFGDLVQGISGSVIHMGEDLLLAGWNLVEVIPDATIGNFPTGRELTTTIFDNGQVIIDYLTDILPTGEAWLRVHAINLREGKNSHFPILYNLEMPEHHSGDVRWQYVRNTPFRKKIETIGALLADIITMKFIGETKFSSDEEHHH